MSQKIMDAELINELKRIIKELGRTPTRDEFDKLSKFSSNAYKRAFGSYGKAVLAVGEKPTFIRHQTKEDVISELQRIYNETGKTPSVKSFNEQANMSYRTAKTIIGDQSWSELLIEAGICKAKKSE